MAEQNNKIADIKGVHKWGGDYYASVVNGDGGRTIEKITKEQYDLLKKQFPEEDTDNTTSSTQEQLVPDLSEQAEQDEVLQENPAEQDSQVIAETNSSVETNDSLKDETINQIISKMLNAGDFRNSGLDIGQKISDIEYAKKKLQNKTIAELQLLLESYDK